MLTKGADRNGNTPLHIVCERISATQTLCSMDVFQALASAFYHTNPNNDGKSPALALNPTELRLKLVSPFANLKRRGSKGPDDRWEDDEDYISSSDGDVSPAMRFFGELMRRGSSILDSK